MLYNSKIKIKNTSPNRMKSTKKLQSTLNIENENTYFLMCWDLFQKAPNTLSIFGMYDKNEFFNIINELKQEQTVSREVIKVEELDIVNVSYFVKISDNIYLSYHIQDSENAYTTINEVELYYKDESDEAGVKEIVEAIDQCSLSFEAEDSINKLNSIILTPEGLDIEPIPLEVDENIELYYSTDTFKSINKLIKNIKVNNKGLSILYGERGTGKTSIIPYISNNLDRIVIYIPNSLLDAVLNNTEFKNFLRTHTKPIIVIDDSENIFNEIYSKANSYTNNILQLVDGLLSDVIELNIILVSNGDLDEIDNALLDANSFIDAVEFKYLDPKEAKALSKHLKLDKKYKNESRLVDVVKKQITKENKKIGLK